jgi:hypothetical protein
MTTLKNKTSVKPKIPIKTKPKIKEIKTKNSVKPPVKLKSLPVKPKSKSKVKLIVEFDKADKEDNPGKYLDKLKKLVFKIKSQTLETDNRIRFGWKF